MPKEEVQWNFHICQFYTQFRDVTKTHLGKILGHSDKYNPYKYDFKVEDLNCWGITPSSFPSPLCCSYPLPLPNQLIGQCTDYRSVVQCDVTPLTRGHLCLLKILARKKDLNLHFFSIYLHIYMQVVLLFVSDVFMYKISTVDQCNKKSLYFPFKGFQD